MERHGDTNRRLRPWAPLLHGADVFARVDYSGNPIAIAAPRRDGNGVSFLRVAAGS